MKTELVTVRRIFLSRDDIEEAIKTYIEAYHELTLTGDCETGPIFQAGMPAGYKAEIVHKTPKIMDPRTKAMAPDQNFKDLQGGYKPDGDKADSISNIDWVEAPDGNRATFGNYR